MPSDSRDEVTVVPADVYDAMQASLDEPDRPNSALADAAAKARSIVALPLSLHEKYTETEGPIEAYKRATGDWTPEMQQALQTASDNAVRRGPVIIRMDYQCPECGLDPTGIRIDAVLFYENDDKLHMGRIAGQADLITIEDCGHSFRRGRL